ncbi:hypothetical protein NT6N_32450 [Oceaniferula spumae]|uniref:Serine aminopeptidase S33 domain-containing protein n=1 Tax=Oceaniferula spumae TaxID=2979115 RepID=A0AAT9FQB9_9BACT
MAKWKKWILGEWSWTRPLKSLAFIYLALLVVALGFSNKLLFQPPKSGYEIGQDDFLLIPRSNGDPVAMYYLEAKAGMPTLLWSHGNAEDIGYLNDRFNEFHARGYGILAYDYPGYGKSVGKPNEESCYDACRTAWEHLTQKLNIPSDQIIIYGQSVGSGPSVWLAEQKPCAGLMLVSPFVSAFRAVTRIPLFPGDQFKNIKRIDKIQTPLLIVHGDQDQVISQWHGKKLYQHHGGPKTFIDIQGAGHNDLYLLAMDEVLDSLDTFRAEIMPAK